MSVETSHTCLDTNTTTSTASPQPAPTDDEDDGDLTPTNAVLPPDGGWGWVIVTVGFLGCLIVDGIIFSFGVVFIDIVDYFQAGTSKASWIGSLMAGMYLTIGPVVSALANKYGCRIVTIVGAIIASVGLALSSFATSVDYLIFTYGILGGIGFGFIYLPCIVMVQFYFDKKRAFATGICVCGSGLGAFIFAPLSIILIEEYGWKGNMLIQSAIVMNVMALGGLLRPLKSKKQKILELSKPLLQRIKEERDADFHESHSAHDFRNYYGNDYINEQDMMSATSNEQLKKTGNNNIGNVIGELDKDLSYRYMIPALTIEEAEEEDEQKDKDQEDSDAKTPISVSTEKSSLRLSHDTITLTPQLAAKDSDRIPRRISMVAPKTQLPILLKSDWERRKSLPVSITQEMQRPFYRQDIFYSGSLCRIPQFSSQHSLPHYHCSVMSIPKVNPEEGSNCFTSFMCPQTVRNTISAMVDVSLLRSVTFVVLCISSSLTMMGFFVPFVYLSNYASDIGVSKTDAAFLFSVIGIANTGGRVFSGWVSDRPKVDALFITNVALTIGGMATALVPLLHRYELLIAYSAIFGLSIACFASLRSIILVDLLGLEKLTNSFGLLLLFQGMASMIGSPLAGFFYDLTETYNTSFMIAGGLIAISGIIGFPLPYISRWEKRKIANELQTSAPNA